MTSMEREMLIQDLWRAVFHTFHQHSRDEGRDRPIGTTDRVAADVATAVVKASRQRIYELVPVEDDE